MPPPWMMALFLKFSVPDLVSKNSEYLLKTESVGLSSVGLADCSVLSVGGGVPLTGGPWASDNLRPGLRRLAAKPPAFWRDDIDGADAQDGGGGGRAAGPLPGKPPAIGPKGIPCGEAVPTAAGDASGWVDIGTAPVDAVCVIAAGVPCLDNENSFIRAMRSWFSPADCPPMEATGRGGGMPPLRAAFNWPRGLEDSLSFPGAPVRNEGTVVPGDFVTVGADAGEGGVCGSLSEPGEMATSSTIGVFWSASMANIEKQVVQQHFSRGFAVCDVGCVPGRAQRNNLATRFFLDATAQQESGSTAEAQQTSGCVS